MKITRFMLTVPPALMLNALADLIIATLAIVSALILIPVTLLKDFAMREIEGEKRRELEMARKKYQDEVERIIRRNEGKDEEGSR